MKSRGASDEFSLFDPYSTNPLIQALDVWGNKTREIYLLAHQSYCKDTWQVESDCKAKIEPLPIISFCCGLWESFQWAGNDMNIPAIEHGLLENPPFTSRVSQLETSMASSGPCRYHVWLIKGISLSYIHVDNMHIHIHIHIHVHIHIHIYIYTYIYI